jgi:acyl-CoA synthetase (AMP-forming)/AMP-acid ligase II
MEKIKTLTEALLQAAADSIQTGHGITFYKETIANKITYQELLERSLRFAGALQQVGAKKGVNILMQINDQEAFVLTFWGSILGGAVPVPLTVNDEKGFHLERVKKVAAILTDCIIVTEDCHKNDLEQALGLSHSVYTVTELETMKEIDTISPHLPNEEDTAFIQFSSGSTSEPKGVCLSHKNNRINLDTVIEVAGGAKLLKQIRTMGWFSLTHNLGLVGYHILPLFIKAEQFLMTPQCFINHTMFILKEIKDKQINSIACPTFLMRWMLTKLTEEDISQLDFSGLISVAMGAEPIHAEIVKKFVDKMRPYGLKKEAIKCNYGMTETVMVVTAQDNLKGVETVQIDGKEYVLNGRPIAGMDVYTIDEYGNRQEEGQVGEIVVESESVMKQYLSFDGVQTVPEGIFKTGDIGVLLKEGMVILGRKKDMIIINAENYYAQDIEAVIEEKTGVTGNDFVITSVLDENQLDQVQLYLLEEIHHQNPDMYKQMAEVFEAYTNSRIADIYTVKEIPRTVSGKKQRFQMRLLEKTNIKEDSKIQAQKPTSDIEIHLAKAWEKVLGISVTDIHSSFFMLGGDSLTAMECIALMNKQNIYITQEMFLANPTIAELAEKALNRSRILSEQEVPSGEIKPLPFHFCLLSYQQDKSIVNQWNLSVMLDFKLLPEKSVIEKIVLHLVQQHDGLRHRFDITGNQLKEFIVDAKECVCVEEKYYHDTDELEKLAAGYQESLDITTCPLKVVAFRKENESNGKILLLCHHALGCAYSFTVLIKDFAAIYRTIAIEKKQFVCREKLTSARQWSELVNQFAWSKECEDDIDYWRKIVDYEDKTPCDYEWTPQINRMKYEKQYEFFICHRDDIEESEGLHYKLLGAFSKTIKEWSGQEQIRLLYSSNGRYGIPSETPYDLSSTVGWLGSTIPICIDLRGGDSPAKLITQTKEALDTVLHGGISYRCLKEINKDPVISQRELPQITFNFVEVNMELGLAKDNAYQITRSAENIGLLEHPEKIRGRMLDFVVYKKDETGYYAKFHYSSKIHNLDTVITLAEQFKNNMQVFLT